MSDSERVANPAWEKVGSLIPAIVQHWRSGEILMLGYMNAEAWEQTRVEGIVTFFSRSRQRIWVKGETSGNRLRLKSMHLDCDRDSILVRAEPSGPTCHRGTQSCFADAPEFELAFLMRLDALIAQREKQRPAQSYTTSLFEDGLGRMAQKVGEEGVELALAAVSRSDADLLDESADLLFHMLVLLRARGLGLHELLQCLKQRGSA